MQTTFFLLDLENVQPDDLLALGVGSYKIKVFLRRAPNQGAGGARARPASLRSGCRIHPDGGHWPQCLGLPHCLLPRPARRRAPQGRFQIISKDAGFDPLIAHLRTQNLLCERLPTLAGRRPASASGGNGRLAGSLNLASSRDNRFCGNGERRRRISLGRSAASEAGATTSPTTRPSTVASPRR